VPCPDFKKESLVFRTIGLESTLPPYNDGAARGVSERMNLVFTVRGRRAESTAARCYTAPIRGVLRERKSCPCSKRNRSRNNPQSTDADHTVGFLSVPYCVHRPDQHWIRGIDHEQGVGDYKPTVRAAVGHILLGLFSFRNTEQPSAAQARRSHVDSEDTSHLGNSGDADGLGDNSNPLYILRFLRLVYSRVESQTPAQELA